MIATTIIWKIYSDKECLQIQDSDKVFIPLAVNLYGNKIKIDKIVVGSKHNSHISH